MYSIELRHFLCVFCEFLTKWFSIHAKFAGWQHRSRTSTTASSEPCCSSNSKPTWTRCTSRPTRRCSTTTIDSSVSRRILNLNYPFNFFPGSIFFVISKLFYLQHLIYIIFPIAYLYAQFLFRAKKNHNEFK